jgi:uncharacterized protein YjbI with pentapeptide repeats
MDLSTWHLVNADLRGTRFCEVNLAGVDFSGADVSGAQFYRSIGKERLLTTKSYQTGSLVGVVLVSLDLANVDFSQQDLTRAKFVQCDLTGADFTDAVITDADFHGCLDTPPTVEQIKSTWNYKHGRMAGVLLAEQLQAALQVDK